MTGQFVGFLALITAISTFAWLAILVREAATHGTIETCEQALAYVSKPGRLFYLNYVNAGLYTLTTTMLFCGLYVTYAPTSPTWSALALAFVPVYTALNLFAYLSQVTLIPRLRAFREQPEYQAAADLLIGQLVQAWQGSAVSVLNGLAYAVLAIPSVIFGVAMLGESAPLPVAGALVALNGVACIVGFVGLAQRKAKLSLGLLLGGGLFALALIPMTIGFL
jgi:hypothetical protein